jgi:hypothetical protein
MTNKVICIILMSTLTILLACCTQAVPPTTYSEDNFAQEPSINGIPAKTIDIGGMDTVYTPSLIPEVNIEEGPSNAPLKGREPVIPDTEFRNIRDEMLIHILGIDSNLPVFDSDENDCDYVFLPYGGVRAKLGEPDYIVQFSELNFGDDIRPNSTKRFYYSNVGLELDIIYECDQPYDVVRYLYISNSSMIKLPSGVGIGSPRDDVFAIYERFIIQGFIPMITSEEVIALGSNVNGVYFVIRDNKVYSIYIAVIGEDSNFLWFLTPSQEYKLYPDRFYPDREYIENAQ